MFEGDCSLTWLGPTRLMHGYLMKNGRPPICSVSNTTITVEHILISPAKYKNKREVMFRDNYTSGSELAEEYLQE